uniref:Uncharacterized protein n=1 Tax=Arundo donax TaxID=35708 RepID=A0A0A8ZMK5_ARUDO
MLITRSQGRDDDGGDESVDALQGTWPAGHVVGAGSTYAVEAVITVREVRGELSSFTRST